MSEIMSVPFSAPSGMGLANGDSDHPREQARLHAPRWHYHAEQHKRTECRCWLGNERIDAKRRIRRPRPDEEVSPTVVVVVTQKLQVTAQVVYGISDFLKNV